MYQLYRNEAFLVRITNVNVFQHTADSFGIHLLGFRYSWWHRRQTNDAVASELNTFSKNHNYKTFFFVAVYPLIHMFWDLHACGGRKLGTHAHGTTTVTLAAHAREG